MMLKKNRKALKALGFTYSKDKEYLYYNFDVSRFRDTLEIKTLLSRIVFDVFFYKNLDSPTTIEIYK